MRYDCAIVGGGPAGLNAALVLGRARRSVALFDNGKPRNAVTHASHGFLTRDGIQPAEFRRIAYEEVLSYPSVRHWPAEVADIERTDDGFVVRASSGEQVQARKIIIAAGLKETLPDIEGVREFYGKGLFNCPFCDGWELRDQPLAIMSNQPGLFHRAKLLLNWSSNLIVCANGGDQLTEEQRQQLAARGVRIIDTPVESFAGRDGRLERVHFTDGTHIEIRGGLIAPVQLPNEKFARALGCETTSSGGIAANEVGKTTAPGVFAAGDSAYVMPSQLIYAAASGSKAAMSVVAELTEENWQRFEAK